MMAAIAAVEDWDGVWFYTYEHNNDRWNGNKMESFFDFRANPAKWAFMPAGAMIFREAGIEPERGTFLSSLVPPTTKETWADPAKAMEAYRFNRGGRGKSAKELSTLLLGETDRDDENGGRGFFLCGGENGAGAVGYGEDFENCSGGKVRIEAPEFCALTLAVIGGGGVDEGTKLLLTACGRAENAGMGFNAERNTVGRKWGQGPTRAEAVTGTLVLPKGEWRAWALKPDGSRGKEVPVIGKDEDGVPLLRMSPEHGTLCYWLECS